MPVYLHYCLYGGVVTATCRTQDSQAVTQREGVTCEVWRCTFGEEHRDLCKTTQDVSIKAKHLADEDKNKPTKCTN